MDASSDDEHKECNVGLAVRPQLQNQKGNSMQTMYDRETLGRAKNPNTRKDSVSEPEKTSEQPREVCKQLVEFSLRRPNAQSVALAGTFNNWDLNLMLRHGTHWKTKLSLASGRYEYRFVVDGEWINDPNAKESRRNDFGSTNSVLVVQ